MIDLANNLSVAAITVERYTPIEHADKGLLSLTALETKSAFASVLERKRYFNKLNPELKIRTSRPLWHLLDSSCGGVCPVGFSCLTIMHDGTVYPCRRLPVKLGTIQEDGIFKIWYTSDALWKLRHRNTTTSACGTCADVGRCGGCRAAAYAETGDLLGFDPLCWKGK